MVFTLIAIAAMVAVTVTVTGSTSTTQGQGLAAATLLLAATPIRLYYGPVDESGVCVIYFGFVSHSLLRLNGGYCVDTMSFILGGTMKVLPESLYCVFK